MAKTKVGVIIGRFQVPALTEAHRKMIATVSEENDGIAILVGVSPTDGRSPENPLTFSQRQPLFQYAADGAAIRKDGTSAAALMVFPLVDHKSDAEWTLRVDQLLRSTFPPDRNEVTLYGGRKSFEQSYTGEYPCKHVNVGSDVSGTATRAAVKAATTKEFLEGQVFALETQYPRCYPTVDTIVWRLDHVVAEPEVLLIQREDNGDWVFIGGFVDPTDESYVRAAQREVYEEVGLAPGPGFKYLGSMRVNDWRYHGSRDQIMTSLYMVQHGFGSIHVNPKEVKDYQWVLVSDVAKILAPVHQPLWDAALPQFTTPSA